MSLWKVQMAHLVEVEADSPSQALCLATMATTGRYNIPQDKLKATILDLQEEDDAPPLYPEYSRRMLEEMYHTINAALRVAALESVGPAVTVEAVNERIGELLDKGQFTAEKAAVIRRLRNVKGTPQ